MKTKTFLKGLCVLFTLTLFLASCSTEEIEDDEIITNILAGRMQGEEPSDDPINPNINTVTLHITWVPSATSQDKEALDRKSVV